MSFSSFFLSHVYALMGSIENTELCRAMNYHNYPSRDFSWMEKSFFCCNCSHHGGKAIRFPASLCPLWSFPCKSHWRAHPWDIPMVVGVEEGSALQLHPLPEEMSWENVFLRSFLLTCYENACDQLCIFMAFWLEVMWECSFSHYFQ